MGYTSRNQVGDIIAHTFRGEAHQLAHVVDIPAATTVWYSFDVNQDKDLILFDRSFAVSQGPVRVSTWTYTTLTVGTQIFTLNNWIVKPPAGTLFTYPATNVAGGFEAIPEYLNGGDNKSAGYSQAGGVVVVPRGTPGAIKVVNESVQTTTFRLFLLFAEVDLSALA